MNKFMKGIWYWYLISTGLMLAAILMSCSNSVTVTDFKYVTVQQLHEQDGVVVSTPISCDPYASGRIVEDLADSTITASVMHDPKEIQIIGNSSEDPNVLILKDELGNHYEYLRDTLETGEEIRGFMFGDRVIVFCDKRHWCHDEAK